MVPPDKGAETSVFLASSPEAQSYTGQYFAGKKVAKTTKHARDAQAAEKLWQISRQYTGLEK
jgi:hypothetical protein